MNKIKYAIVVIILFCIALGVYFVPRIMSNKKIEIQEKIKATNAAFTKKILDEFNTNPNRKASEISQQVCDELNKTSVNPYNKNSLAYTFEKNCKGCNSVEYDDDLSMVIVTTYDNKGELSARTVIKPPSFVTYTKEDQNENKEEKK